jgi:hypothetical protein
VTARQNAGRVRSASGTSRINSELQEAAHLPSIIAEGLTPDNQNYAIGVPTPRPNPHALGYARTASLSAESGIARAPQRATPGGWAGRRYACYAAGRRPGIRALDGTAQKPVQKPPIKMMCGKPRMMRNSDVTRFRSVSCGSTSKPTGSSASWRPADLLSIPCQLLNVPGELDNITVGVPDFRRRVPRLLSPLDLWDTSVSEAHTNLTDRVSVWKVTTEMDALDNVRGQGITLDERHHEAVVKAQTDTPVLDGGCTGQSDPVHVELRRPLRVADVQGEVANLHARNHARIPGAEGPRAALLGEQSECA